MTAGMAARPRGTLTGLRIQTKADAPARFFEPPLFERPAVSQ